MSLDSALQLAPERSSTHPTTSQNYHHESDMEASPQLPLTRPSRACTLRSVQRLNSPQQQQKTVKRKHKSAKKEQHQQEVDSPQHCTSSGTCNIITPLLVPPEASQMARWNLRAMWELASVLNFLHVFRPLLNITVEVSAEEFETALITPNDTLSDIHMPLLKAIPPIIRMALTRNTRVTVLCRKLRDRWHWVAEGDISIVASQGVEIDIYKSLDPGVRVVILKALCDIRVEQEDIRNYIDRSLKYGGHLSAFRKERIGGETLRIHYWYEDDPLVGNRLYREIREVVVKKARATGSQVLPNSSYQWEAVATNFEEFLDVICTFFSLQDKLFSSTNRTEVSVGKKLKIDILPEIEKEHKRKEKLLKRQHRQALLLDNICVDGIGSGRSFRYRKPVTYTFDDYEKSINEAIKITKKRQSSPEPIQRKEFTKPEPSTNGKWIGHSHVSQDANFNSPSPESLDYDDYYEDNSVPLDRSNRRRQRPQRYSVQEYVEAISENEADFDSDDDIVGEAIYDEEYLRKRKQKRNMSSGSEGDEEYHWDEDNAEEEEEEEDFLGISEDSDELQKFRKTPIRTRRETKLRSVGEFQSGLRRSKRATRNRIDYKQYEVSESETESVKPKKSSPSDDHSNSSENVEYSMGSPDSDGNDDQQEIKISQPIEIFNEMTEIEQSPLPEKPYSPGQDEVEVEGVQKRRFLDLNELAPVSGFDDAPNPIMKDDDKNDL